MSHFRKLSDRTGYDSVRNLQVIPMQQRAIFYLIAGSGLVVSVDDMSIVSPTAGDSDDKGIHKSTELNKWEKEQDIRKIVLTGKKAGSTKLRARLNGSDWAQPISLRVVTDQQWREVGKALGEVTPELRAELQQLSLREAVMRIAEDQMHSSIASKSDGFGVYNPQLRSTQRPSV